MRLTTLLLLLSLPRFALAAPILLHRPLRATQIALGGLSSCALLETKQIKCWGVNWYGGLGIPGRYFAHGTSGSSEVGPFGNRLASVDFGTGRHVKFLASGDRHACVILDNDRVKCWGSNFNGELGIDKGDQTKAGRRHGLEKDDMGDKLPYLDIGEGRKAVSIVMGWSEQCVLLDDDSVKCWSFGRKFTASFGKKKPRSLALGMNHFCALLDDGSVSCWGRNDFGQLGMGHENWTGRDERANDLAHVEVSEAVDMGRGRTAKQISAMKWSTCALLDDNSVRCWGHNANGELGTGDRKNRGQKPAEMGDALKPIDLGEDLPIAEIFCGQLSNACCVRFSSDAVKCWGRNEGGVLGLEDTRDRGGRPEDLGENLPFLPLGARSAVQYVVPSEHHACALLTNGGIKCWGKNYFGGLGSSDTKLDRGVKPGTMGESLPYLNLGTTFFLERFPD